MSMTVVALTLVLMDNMRSESESESVGVSMLLVTVSMNNDRWKDRCLLAITELVEDNYASKITQQSPTDQYGSGQGGACEREGECLGVAMEIGDTAVSDNGGASGVRECFGGNKHL